MLQYTESEASRLGMQIDMNTGTGWPFGGPEVGIEDAACKLFVTEYRLEGGNTLDKRIEVADKKQKPYAKLERLMAFSDTGKCLDLTDKVKDGMLCWKAPKGSWRLIAAFCGKTLQKVKRAAPGGEGYVMNHFSARAVKTILDALNALLTEGSRIRQVVLQLIPIISLTTPMRFTGRTGRKDFLMSFWRVAVINWKNTCRSFWRQGSVRTRPGASSPIIVKLSVNCCRRISPVSGRSGRIGTGLKPEIRLMARREI